MIRKVLIYQEQCAGDGKRKKVPNVIISVIASKFSVPLILSLCGNENPVEDIPVSIGEQTDP